MHTHTHTHIHAHIMIYLYFVWVVLEKFILTCNPATESLKLNIAATLIGCNPFIYPATKN